MHQNISFSSFQYLLLAAVLFFGGCLFSQSSSISATNNQPSGPVICDASIALANAESSGCVHACQTDSDCDSEPGFRCANNICEAFCRVGCTVGDSSCLRCDGELCESDTGCVSGFCDNGECAEAISDQCANGVKDGGEEGIDCGGPCPECVIDCTTAEDCRIGQFCDEGLCSDCQCGVGSCGKCDGASCVQSNECQIGSFCQGVVCAPVHCRDGKENETEQGIDCGGPCALKCLEDSCDADDECKSKRCLDTICVADSCDDFDGQTGEKRLFVSPSQPPIEVYCAAGGWTLLAIAAKDSDFWNADSRNWMNEVNPTSKPGDPSVVGTDVISAAYTSLPTNEVKLCYKDLDRCFVFNHQKGKSLSQFFRSDDSYYTADTQPFLDALGFKIIEPGNEGAKIDCLKLAMNHQEGRGKIGLLGDIDSCTMVKEDLDDLALGLGMTAISSGDDDENSGKSGFSRYVYEDNTNPVDAPNGSHFGPWLIFGR